jgi:NADH-quinone oxidoreductase subunit L
MENLPQQVPLIVFIPLIGFVINAFWGARLGERTAGYIGCAAALLSFVIALLMYSYLLATNYQAVVVNPAILDGWLRIPSIGLEIPWQMRVDTLSVTMMLVVTGVGSLIHIYSIGYMRGDPSVGRFFSQLNLFLVFMLILVTGNNFLVMFVGWEGVGLCSYLLIGFWWDRPNGVGWNNSNAARKAFIVNRIGDFGLLMGLFLIFTTFGTMDFYRPGEVANPAFNQKIAAEQQKAGATAEAQPEIIINNDKLTPQQFGVFGQAEQFLKDGKQVQFGPFSLDIQTVLVLITFFMLLGAAGKSAQIPLFVWLPDAMAGPTPVSALIHAATMVTAGVYMMVRANVFFDAAQATSLLVTIIGAATAIMAGFIALGQWDIKRVLAYSTISQLGFMVAAVGVGAYSAAMFHLVTHAFFKALLFLGSGSVIHGVEHGAHETHDHVDPQDMRVMGGLKQRMPLTYWTYVIATLAIAGIWPLAGFWSKDEILANSWRAGIEGNNVGGYIGLLLLLAAAGFTAFYMWRQVEMVFHGEARSRAAEHAHESAPSMTVVLVILAFFTIVAGFVNTPKNGGIFTVFGLFERLFDTEQFTFWLESSVAHAHPAEFQFLLAWIALAIGVGAILVARSIYGHNHALTAEAKDPLQANPNTGAVWGLANARLYWDEVYHRLFLYPFQSIAKFLADVVDWAFLHDYIHNTVIWRGFDALAKLLSQPFDLGIIDGAVNGVGVVVRWSSGRLRRVQTGYVRTYAVALLLGVIFVIVVMLLPWLQR